MPAIPTTRDPVGAWLKARAAADGQMRAAARERTAEPPEADDDGQDAITVLGGNGQGRKGQDQGEREGGAS